MKGMWMNQAESWAATGLGALRFNKLKPTLKQRNVGKGKKRFEFFITEDLIKPTMKEAYKDRLTEIDGEAQEVESILGDLTEGINLLPGSSDELKEAQLANIKARTSLINEKLDARKTELFSEWSERFFEIFSNAFAKFKNDLISLHLSEDQLNVLTEKLELALKSMDDGIAQINSDFMKEEDNAENN